ncbi:MAG: ProQ/FINO family protein, partial [Pseudomonadota bacterium]
MTTETLPDAIAAQAPENNSEFRPETALETLATSTGEAGEAAQAREPRAPRHQRNAGRNRPQGGNKPRQPQNQPAQNAAKHPPRQVNPVLERLFELYPHLFGAQFLPLKLGVFHELMAKHPEDFKKDELKL